MTALGLLLATLTRWLERAYAPVLRRRSVPDIDRVAVFEAVAALLLAVVVGWAVVRLTSAAP